MDYKSCFPGGACTPPGFHPLSVPGPCLTGVNSARSGNRLIFGPPDAGGEIGQLGIARQSDHVCLRVKQARTPLRGYDQAAGLKTLQAFGSCTPLRPVAHGEPNVARVAPRAAETVLHDVVRAVTVGIGLVPAALAETHALDAAVSVYDLSADAGVDTPGTGRRRGPRQRNQLGRRAAEHVAVRRDPWEGLAGFRHLLAPLGHHREGDLHNSGKLGQVEALAVASHRGKAIAGLMRQVGKTCLPACRIRHGCLAPGQLAGGLDGHLNAVFTDALKADTASLTGQLAVRSSRRMGNCQRTCRRGKKHSGDNLKTLHSSHLPFQENAPRPYRDNDKSAPLNYKGLAILSHVVILTASISAIGLFLDQKVCWPR